MKCLLPAATIQEDQTPAEIPCTTGLVETNATNATSCLPSNANPDCDAESVVQSSSCAGSTLTDAEADAIRKTCVPVNPDGDEVTELKYSKLEREVHRTNKRDRCGSERETAGFKASDLENLLKAVIPGILAKQLSETKNELVSEMKEAMMEEIKD